MKVHPPGTHLGQFEVISYPITSDVSIDYTCLDRERSCPVVVKTLRPELLPSRIARNCFAKSGAAWVDLDAHPHIVSCHKVLEPKNSDEVYLVLQAVVSERERDTPSLLSWLIPGHPLPVLQSLLFALQIARGMRYVTDKIPGFVHGDIKPENVLVSGGRLSQANVNRLRLTGFGLADVLRADDVDLSKFLETQEPAVGRTQLINGVVGTPLYMSPEQWRGECESTATDIYALGCLLYKMLVGRHPVAGKTTQDLRNAHCTGNVRPLPASLPECVPDLVTRCLALEPGERYQSWEEVETAIAVAYEGTINFPVPVAEPTDALTEAERVLEGWFMNSMGCASSEIGNLDTAVECLELALKAGQTEGVKALEGAATNNLGVAFRGLGDTQRAIEHHEKALTIARESGDRPEEGSALNNLGLAYLQLGNPRQAIEYLEQALIVSREIGDRREELATLVNIGSVHHQLGDLHRSIECYEQVLEVARKIGDRRGESSALANLGGVYSDLGDDRRAIQYQEQSLAIKYEIGDRQSQIVSLNNLANAYRNLGQAQRAFEYYNKALEISREMGDRRGEAFALNNMGSTYSNLGDMERALEHHEQALEIFREIGDKRSQGDCLTNLAFIYKSRHDSDKAIKYCELALAIDREVGDMLGLALDSFNLANLLAQQHRFREALSYAEESAHILEKVGHTDKSSQAQQLVDMIRSELDHQTSGAAGMATAAFLDLSQQILKVRRDNPTLTANMSDEDILELFKQPDQAFENDRPTAFMVWPPKDAEQARTKAINQDLEKRSLDELIVVGQQLDYKGQWQEAEQAFNILLKKANQANNIGYQSLALLFQGRLCSKRGDQSHALSLFRKALSLAKHVDDLQLLCEIYDGMGTAYKYQGNYKEAIEHYNDAMEIYKRLGDGKGTIIIQANLGNVYLDQGDFERATKAFKDLLDYTIPMGAEQVSARAYCNLGIVYQRQGLRDLAIEMELKSLEIALRIGDQLTAAYAYENLGSIRTEQGDYPTAIQMVREALVIEERLGMEPDVANKYMDLANLYTKMGDPMFAFLSYDRALIFYERIGDYDGQAKIHFNMGNLYRQQGKSVQACKQYMQAQAIFESIGKLDNARDAERQWRAL